MTKRTQKNVIQTLHRHNENLNRHCYIGHVDTNKENTHKKAKNRRINLVNKNAKLDPN